MFEKGTMAEDTSYTVGDDNLQVNGIRAMDGKQLLPAAKEGMKGTLWAMNIIWPSAGN
jgi:hypothetical protein